MSIPLGRWLARIAVVFGGAGWSSEFVQLKKDVSG